MMQQKISIISFDNWNYDRFLVLALQKKGIEATHIKIGGFKHKNLIVRIQNSLSKFFLNKNPKIKKRQEYILETLEKIGFQDQILVINPELIEVEYHKKIKNFTNKYIAYLYDSMSRCPAEHLLDGYFDKIFSFDREDSEKYKLDKINNYIYLEKSEKIVFDTKFKVATVSSFDKRFYLFNKIADKLTEMNQRFDFVFVSRNIWFKILKYNNKHKEKINKNIKFQSKKVLLNDVNALYNNSLIILDLVQGFQSGLSFRVFESLALQKKIITDNKNIMNYDFYNPNNILVIDKENLQLEQDFFAKPYHPIPNEIYDKYTVNTWIETVFNLK